MAQLRHELPSIRQAGAELVAVGLGKVQHLQWFMEALKPEFPVFTDPSMKLYEALDFKRGLGTMFSFGMLKAAVGAVAEGHYQTTTRGDPLQHGGVIVARPDGTMPYYFASAFAGDHPPIAPILAALKG